MATLVISKQVIKTLATSCNKPVLLLGWAEGPDLMCCSCCTATSRRLMGSFEVNPDQQGSSASSTTYVRNVITLFPAGIGIVGLYKVHSGEQENDDVETVFSEILASELKDFIINPLLAYIDVPLKEPKGKDRGPRTVFLYDTGSAEITKCCLILVERESLVATALNIRLRGRLPITFETSDDVELLTSSIRRAFDLLQERITSPACAFCFQGSSVVLWNSDAPLNNSSNLGDDDTCIALLSTIDKSGDTKIKDKKLFINVVSSVDFSVHNMDLLLQVTGDEATRHTLSCVPIIRYERKNFKSVSLVLGMDVVATIPSKLPVVCLPALLADGICSQLVAMEHCLCTFFKEKGKFYLPEVHHFLLPGAKHFVSAVYPEGVEESELHAYRTEMHERLLLPVDRPYLRRTMKHQFLNEMKCPSSYLQNVHVGLPSSGIRDGLLADVQGTYTYYHYMQDNMNDNGWGCAYRSLQTLVSWFRHQGYTKKPVPTHTEIQQALVDIGDKPSSFVNSRKWIGSLEVSYCLDHLLGVTSKIIFVSSGEELATKSRELLYHFMNQGTPIMIGGGVLAHTILGVDFDENTGDTKFLVLDPHYTGSEDLHTIQSKGWCGWKGLNFWNQTAYYNLCCPQRPTGV